MVQDITPTNSQSATNTNTMKPKDISAQSAGSITPTIVSQSNADRRRRNAAEKAARSNQSLAANVERSNVERAREFFGPQRYPWSRCLHCLAHISHPVTTHPFHRYYLTIVASQRYQPSPHK